MTASQNKPRHSITVYSKPGCVQCADAPRNLLSDAPPYVHWFAEHGEFDADERVVGYYTETVPDGPNRVKPGLWVVVTDRGIYTLDAEKELCVRAKVLHRFTD